ncbi:MULTISPECIES: OmpA family protein [Burkholderia cepacia complex]
MAIKFLTAVALTLSCAHVAFACDGPSNMPAHYIDIVFDTDSSAISSTELSRLSAWSSDLHKRFPIIDTVWLVGLAEKTERDAQQLATRRAENVMNALGQFSIRGEKSDFMGHIFKPDEFGQSGRRVEVNVSPGCPDHCCPNLNPKPKTR